MLEFDKIIELVEQIGLFLNLERQKKEYQIMQKEDGTTVTEMDYVADVLIKKHINDYFGNVKIISEEDDDIENCIINDEPYFLIDPIDGTKSFIQNGNYSINLSYIEKQKNIFSLIHSPFENISLFALKNESFFKNNNKVISKLEPFNNKKYHFPQQINITTGKTTFSSPKSKINTDIINNILAKYEYSIQNVYHESSAIKINQIIQNKTDLIVYNQCCLWDVSSAQHILNNLKIHSASIMNKDLSQYHLSCFLISKDVNLIDIILKELNEIE